MYTLKMKISPNSLVSSIGMKISAKFIVYTMKIKLVQSPYCILLE